MELPDELLVPLTAGENGGGRTNEGGDGRGGDGGGRADTTVAFADELVPFWAGGAANGGGRANAGL